MTSKKTLEINNKKEKFVLTVLTDDILHLLYLPNSVLEIDDIKEALLAYDSLPNPKPLRVITEMGKYATITSEARSFASENSPHLNKVAYVITGLPQRLLLRFFLKMMKNKKVTKVFLSFEDAYKWVSL